MHNGNKTLMDLMTLRSRRVNRLHKKTKLCSRILHQKMHAQHIPCWTTNTDAFNVHTRTVRFFVAIVHCTSALNTSSHESSSLQNWWRQKSEKKTFVLLLIHFITERNHSGRCEQFTLVSLTGISVLYSRWSSRDGFWIFIIFDLDS